MPPEREEELPTFFGYLFIVSLVAEILLLQFISYWSLALVPLAIGIWLLKVRSFARSLAVEPSGPPPFDRRQASLNAAQASGTVRLWVQLILSLAFVASGFWVRSLGLREGVWVIAMFGLCALVFAWQLVVLTRK